MSNCKKLDPLVTPYVDGALDAVERTEVDAHLRLCPPCRARVAAERAVRHLLQARKPALQRVCAPRELRARCAATGAAAADGPRPRRLPATVARWRWPVRQLALVATLVLIVGGVFVYELTVRSAHVMAAELVADHVKCFGLGNSVPGAGDRSALVEQSIAASLDWRPRLPERPEQVGLALLGARLCLYGNGRVCHIMYLHNGHPLSVFMLPRTTRPEEVLDVLGHQAAIWSIGDRTFVLVTREPRGDIERTVSFVQAALR
jgi:anti-sigma factor RsiW